MTAALKGHGEHVESDPPADPRDLNMSAMGSAASTVTVMTTDVSTVLCGREVRSFSSLSADRPFACLRREITCAERSRSISAYPLKFFPKGSSNPAHASRAPLRWQSVRFRADQLFLGCARLPGPVLQDRLFGCQIDVLGGPLFVRLLASVNCPGRPSRT